VIDQLPPVRRLLDGRVFVAVNVVEAADFDVAEDVEAALRIIEPHC